jgi:protein-disulfide isomerase
MKGFYALLGLIVLGGIGWLAYSSRSKPHAVAGGGTAPIPVASSDNFNGYTLGSDSAKVEITEYSDFQCPYCAGFAAVQMPVVRDQLINPGRARLRFRDFPIPGHKHAREAAHAAQCVGEQGKFWAMHDLLFEHREWTEERSATSTLRGLAGQAGANLDQYDACMSSNRYDGRITASFNEGQARGVTGTPAFFINGVQLTGRPTSDALKDAVDRASPKHAAR